MPDDTVERDLELEIGQQVLAECSLEILRHLSLYSRRYSELGPVERRRNANLAITAIRAAIASRFGDEDLQILDELKDALHWADANWTHPLLAHAEEAGSAEKILKDGPAEKHKYHFYQAWLLAALQRLEEEGNEHDEAVRLVAQKIRRRPKTIEGWVTELKADSARFLPEEGGKHRQRLRFRANLCFSYAAEHGLSGRKMLKMIRTDRALVARLSLRAPHINARPDPRPARPNRAPLSGRPSVKVYYEVADPNRIRFPYGHRSVAGKGKRRSR